MFSCNNNSIFCDQTFWIVVIIAIIFLWVHYSCNEGGCKNECGCADNSCNQTGNDYCC